MSLSKLWDRAWWGFMIFIFVGLVWLKFLDPIIACVWPGVIFATLCGGLYLYTGIRNMQREKDQEEN
jgi:hypothetical protein